MALEIDWREPPASPEARLKAELKKNPGRWARIKTNMASTTSAPGWRKEGFEVQAHPVDGATPKKYDIYARWPSMATRVAARVEAGTINKDDEHAAAGVADIPPTRSKAPAPHTQPPALKNDPQPQMPTKGDVTGGYLASRANRAVDPAGAKTVRLAGQNPSPVRP